MKKKLIDELPEEFQELFRFAKVYKNELDRKDAKETSESDELLGLSSASKEDVEEEKQKSTTNDLDGQIKRLKEINELYKSGLIDAEELKLLKNKILSN